MLFPNSPRTVYDRNPLREVVFQAKFPPILRIETELPTGFQDRIRSQYPFYQDSTGSVVVPENLPPELIPLFQRASPSPSGMQRHHRFTEFEHENTWEATLTRDFCALKTVEYRRWEEFRERIQVILDALSAEYRPTFFSRIGLRYVDVIQRSHVALDGVPWSELLSAPIAGEFSDSRLSGAIEHAAREVVFRMENGGRVTIRHGIVLERDSREQCFVVDSDFFTTERTEIANVIGILDRFNGEAGRLFRWCVLEKLRTALGPTEVH